MKTIDGQQKRYEDRFFDKDFEKASHREGVVQKELHRGDVFFYLPFPYVKYVRHF